MKNLKTLLRFTIIGVAGAATAGAINGLLPETTAATLTCNRMICERQNNNQFKCTCDEQAGEKLSRRSRRATERSDLGENASDVLVERTLASIQSPACNWSGEISRAKVC